MKASSSKKVEEDVVYTEDYNIVRPTWNWEKINDWGKRIAKYTDKQKKFYSDMVPKIQEMKGIFESDQGWTLLVDNQENGIKI